MTTSIFDKLLLFQMHFSLAFTWTKGPSEILSQFSCFQIENHIYQTFRQVNISKIEEWTQRTEQKRISLVCQRRERKKAQLIACAVSRWNAISTLEPECGRWCAIVPVHLFKESTQRQPANQPVTLPTTLPTKQSNTMWIINSRQ